MNPVIIFSLLTMAMHCQGFFLDHFKAKYDALTRSKYSASNSAPTTFIPQPAPIAYGYGSGIVVEYAGQSYYVGPTNFPQPQQNVPSFPYKGGPVLTPTQTSNVYLVENKEQYYEPTYAEDNTLSQYDTNNNYYYTTPITQDLNTGSVINN